MDSSTKALFICIGVIIIVVIVGAIIFAMVWSPRLPSNDPATTTEEPSDEDDKPDVYIIANETEIEQYDDIQFEIGGNKGDRPIEAEWNFGDGSDISTRKNPTHTFRKEGKFEVTLTVTDEDGDVDTEEKNIVVGDVDDSGSNGSSTRIPVYDPYYFIITFIALIAISMVFIKKRIS